MTALRVLVVDDEAPARLRLVSLLAQCRDPLALCVGEATQATAALLSVRELQPDVALLDIGLPGASGLQLARALREQAPGVAVVFVTAHAEHAVHAFELDAVDYLTKPVRAERLEAALRRVVQRRQPQVAPIEAAMLSVTDRGRLLRLPLAEVLYVKAESKYLTLRTATQRLVLDDALADLEQRLGAGFLRIHRNAVVARGAVRALERRSDVHALVAAEGLASGEGWWLRVAPVDEWLAVSRRLIGPVREALLAAGR